MSVKQAAMEKEAMNFQPFFNFLGKAGKQSWNAAKRGGDLAQRWNKFLFPSGAQPAPAPRLSPQRSAAMMKRQLLNESGPIGYDAGGNRIKGLFSGVSQGAGGAVIRGIGGYQYGNAFDNDPDNTNGGYPHLPWLSNLGLMTGAAAAISPRLAAMIAKKVNPKSVLGNPQVMANTLGQPIVRGGAGLVAGDYLEAANNFLEIAPGASGWIKPITMGLSLGLGTRPLLQGLGSRNPKLAKELGRWVPRGLASIVNSSTAPGASLVKSSLRSQAPWLLMSNAFIAPEVRHWSSVYRVLSDQANRPEVQDAINKGINLREVGHAQYEDVNKEIREWMRWRLRNGVKQPDTTMTQDTPNQGLHGELPRWQLRNGAKQPDTTMTQDTPNQGLQGEFPRWRRWWADYRRIKQSIAAENIRRYGDQLADSYNQNIPYIDQAVEAEQRAMEEVRQANDAVKKAKPYVDWLREHPEVLQTPDPSK
jgi:hypothetical protein